MGVTHNPQDFISKGVAKAMTQPIHSWTNAGSPLTSIMPDVVPLNQPSDELALAIRQRSPMFPTSTTGIALRILDEAKHIPLVLDIAKLEELHTKWNKDSIGWKLVKFLGAKGINLKLAPPLFKLMTMTYSLDNNGRNPAFQSVTLKYHGSWTRWTQGAPLLTLSLQGWLGMHIGEALVTDALLRGIFYVITDGLGDLTDDFEIIPGSSPDAPERFTHAYTHNVSGEGYPSVSGSCMRHPADSWNTDGIHPVVTYCTKDISLARIKDATGNTRCRVLLNHIQNTFTRMYVAAENSSKATELMAVFDRMLRERGFTPSFDTGLKGCSLRLLPTTRGEHKFLIAPYIDGTHRMVNIHTGIVGYQRTKDTIEFGSTSALAALPQFYCCKCSTEVTSDAFTHGSSFYCARCHEVHFSDCVSCGDHHQTTFMVRVNGGGRACHDCVDTLYSKCSCIKCRLLTLTSTLDKDRRCVTCGPKPKRIRASRAKVKPVALTTEEQTLVTQGVLAYDNTSEATPECLPSPLDLGQAQGQPNSNQEIHGLVVPEVVPLASSDDGHPRELSPRSTDERWFTVGDPVHSS